MQKGVTSFTLTMHVMLIEPGGVMMASAHIMTGMHPDICRFNLPAGNTGKNAVLSVAQAYVLIE